MGETMLKRYGGSATARRVPAEAKRREPSGNAAAGFLRPSAIGLVMVMVAAASAPGQAAEEEDVVTIAYNEYFRKTFGPADPPLDAVRRAVGERYPDIRVEFVLAPLQSDAWHDTYARWFEQHDGTADLLGVATYWIPEYGMTDWLLPLNDVVDPEILDDLMPAFLDAFTAGDRLLALGPWWGGIGGLYYRTDLLDEHGVEPPATYDELVAAVRAIRAERPDLLGWVWPAAQDQVLTNRWIEFLHGFGGRTLDEGGRCILNDEHGSAALEFMTALVSEGITPADALAWKEEGAAAPFAAGEAIFLTGRQDLSFWLDDPARSDVAGDWAFIPMPAAPQGRRTGFFEAWGFGINRYSDNPGAAAKVLEVMFSPEVQKRFNLSQGPLQAHAAVYADPEVIAHNPHMPAFQEVAATAAPPIPSPEFNEISTILSTELHSALRGEKAAQEALNAACAAIDRLSS